MGAARGEAAPPITLPEGDALGRKYKGGSPTRIPRSGTRPGPQRRPGPAGLAEASRGLSGAGPRRVWGRRGRSPRPGGSPPHPPPAAHKMEQGPAAASARSDGEVPSTSAASAQEPGAEEVPLWDAGIGGRRSRRPRAEAAVRHGPVRPVWRLRPRARSRARCALPWRLARRLCPLRGFGESRPAP